MDFAFEASVIAARGADGAFAAYDPPENKHENHILRRSTVPGRLSKAQGDEAKAIARGSPRRWIMSVCWRSNCLWPTMAR